MVSATGTGPFGAPGELAHPAENANRITAVAIPSRRRDGRSFGTSGNGSSARSSGIHRPAGGAGTGKRVGGITNALVVMDTCACWGVAPSVAATEAGDTVQVEPMSAPAHARPTGDLNPPIGVMVTVNVRVFPAFTFSVAAGPVNPKSGAAVPFPLSVMICGLPPASSASDSVPVRAPKEIGRASCREGELAPAAEVAGLVGQALAPVLIAAKSPEAANEFIVKAAGPVFVIIACIGVVLSASGWLPMPALVGANPTPGAVPFPLSVMICGLPPGSAVRGGGPVRAPEAVGVKVTLMVQFAPAAKVAGLVGQALAPVLGAAKSLEAANELIVKAAAPVFVSVTVIGALVVASSWLPKSRLVGANPTPGAVPFPLRENICGLPPASSASDSVPVRAPEAVGVKVTLMVQFAPAAKVAGLVGQALAPVLVAAKSLEAANELIVKAAAPVFVSVTVIGALVVASSWLPKSRLVGANPTPGAFEPVPIKHNIGRAQAWTAVTNQPRIPPDAFRVKVTCIVLVTLLSKVPRLLRPTLFPYTTLFRSLEAANELIVKAAAPVFVSVTVIGALVVASSWLPKSRPVGANPTPGEFEPVPLRLTFCGLFKSSSVKTSVAASAAATDGVKVTLTLH